MNILNKYNKKPMFEYDNEKDRAYINLQQLFTDYGSKQVYVVHALFINKKSRYGDAPVFVIENHFVNAPHHLTNTVNEMINDTEIINLVNSRKLGFTIYQYESKNGNGYSVEWVIAN